MKKHTRLLSVFLFALCVAVSPAHANKSEAFKKIETMLQRPANTESFTSELIQIVAICGKIAASKTPLERDALKAEKKEAYANLRNELKNFVGIVRMEANFDSFNEANGCKVDEKTTEAHKIYHQMDFTDAEYDLLINGLVQAEFSAILRQ